MLQPLLNILLIIAFQVLIASSFRTLTISKSNLYRPTASVEKSMSTSSKAENQLETIKKMSFDPALLDEYESALSTVIAFMGPGKKKERKIDFSPAKEYLMSRHAVLSKPNVEDESFNRESMVKQQEMFLAKTNLSQAQYDYVGRVLTYLGHFSAKTKKPSFLKICWHKILESGIIPQRKAIAAYMYTLSLDEESAHLSGEIAAYHNKFFDPDEGSISIRIKGLIIDGDANGAEQLLKTLPDTKLARLRTYQPILYYYCDKADLNSALRLYAQMRKASSVHFDSDTYAILIGSIAQNGGFRKDATPIDEAIQVYFHNTHGPKLFDELAQEMANDIVEITNSSAVILHNAFFNGFRDSLPSAQVVSTDSQIITSTTCAQDTDIILNRVAINARTGVCPRSQVRLKLYKLDQNQRENLCGTLFQMAKDNHKDYHFRLMKRKKIKNKALSKNDLNSTYAVSELESFCDWLQRKGPFTAIVDGANVLYHGHGDVHYSQIQHVIKKLEEMNEKPLIVMPSKYAQRAIHIRYNFVQILDEKSAEYLERLEQEHADMFYKVPSKVLDDYYWMIASVVGDKLSDVDADESPDRFPGCRPMLITNDQMRDHKLELLESRQFRRWYSCHIVNYELSHYSDEDEWGSREVTFSAADVFSNEIQGNQLHEATESTGSLVWHLPVREWDKYDRLCIRLV